MKEETTITLMRMVTDLTLATLDKARVDTKYGMSEEVSKMTMDIFNDCAKAVFNNYHKYSQTDSK
jgi:hypothetical protein